MYIAETMRFVGVVECQGVWTNASAFWWKVSMSYVPP